jgi:hypothetical protein
MPERTKRDRRPSLWPTVPAEAKEPAAPARKAKIHLPIGNVLWRVERRGRDGHWRLEREERTENKVTASGRNIARDLLGGTGYSVSSFEVGSDGSAPLDQDLQLGQGVFRKRIDRRIPKPSSIVYEVYIDDTEANGYTLQESGLFADERWYADGALTPGANGRLFARTIYTAIEKDSSVVFTGLWEIPISSE